LDAGIEPEEIKILSLPTEIQDLYRNLVQSASSEISLIMPSPNALLRQHKIGLTDFIETAATERGVQVSLAIPRLETDRQWVQEIEELPTRSPNISVRRYLSGTNQDSKIKSTILLVDKQSSLIIDLKDDSKGNFIEAIGPATYSKNRSRTQSYNFIFDTIWRQADLYTRLELKTIELERLISMQNEFVNVAAHELRTPAQAILGYSEMLELGSNTEKTKLYEKAITRNAERLYSLTTDILDVARIESQTLKLNKSYFDLNQEIEKVIKDIVERPSWVEISNNVSLIFEPSVSTTIYGDRERINQVIQNLVNNALKFTDTGTIKISVEKNKCNETIVTVTDTGTGIAKEIFPRLFNKFATKSKSGTGLGLYISKAIIEAHGGSIEAYNNTEGNGATFRFTVPFNNASNES
jgi:signal transduction histidine kinase